MCDCRPTDSFAVGTINATTSNFTKPVMMKLRVPQAGFDLFSFFLLAVCMLYIYYLFSCSICPSCACLRWFEFFSFFFLSFLGFKF